MNPNRINISKELASGQHTRSDLVRRMEEQGGGLESAATGSVTMDRGVPFEVWQQICSYLYPSQVSRMSMVSTTLHDVVDLLPYWSFLFRKLFGSKVALCLLPRVPESRSYMLYMCAFSSMVCERCYEYFDSNLEAGNAASLPLPTRVEAYRRKHEGIQLVGYPVDPNWTIQMYFPCRKNHFTHLKERIPYAAQTNYITGDLVLKKYALNLDYFSSDAIIRYGSRGTGEYLESDVIKIARSEYGGDVGIRAMVAGSLEERFERSNRRIMDYSHR